MTEKSSGSSLLSELRRGEPMEGREQKADRLPKLTLRLEEMTEGKHLARGVGILYGTLLGAPVILPGNVIQFVFEGAWCIREGHWKFADWQATIVPAPPVDGKAMYILWCQLSESKLDFIRYGKGCAILDVKVEAAEIVGRN